MVFWNSSRGNLWDASHQQKTYLVIYGMRPINIVHGVIRIQKWHPFLTICYDLRVENNIKQVHVEFHVHCSKIPSKFHVGIYVNFHEDIVTLGFYESKIKIILKFFIFKKYKFEDKRFFHSLLKLFQFYWRKNENPRFYKRKWFFLTFFYGKLCLWLAFFVDWLWLVNGNTPQWNNVPLPPLAMPTIFYAFHTGTSSNERRHTSSLYRSSRFFTPSKLEHTPMIEGTCPHSTEPPFFHAF